MVQPQCGDADEATSLGPITGADHTRPVPEANAGRATPMLDPKEPSAAEIAEHTLTHLPYKCWCKYCLAGRRPNAQHRRQKIERSIPMVSLDYVFFRDPGGDSPDLYRGAH